MRVAAMTPPGRFPTVVYDPGEWWSHLAASGVLFTLDPESGHRGIILLTASWGLGEAVVQGQVVPDQFYVHKPTLRDGYRSLVWKTIGSKERRMVYASAPGEKLVELEPVPEELRSRVSERR